MRMPLLQELLLVLGPDVVKHRKVGELARLCAGLKYQSQNEHDKKNTVAT